MAATDAPLTAEQSTPTNSRRAGRRGGTSPGPDRLTVALFSVTAFLVVLAVLTSQLPAVKHDGSRPEHVLRKIYQTTVIETIVGDTGPSGTSVSQSVSSSRSVGSTSVPTTRAS